MKGGPISASGTSTWTTSVQQIYVDVNQTGSGEDGTPNNPYKTIQGAVDAVIALADNSDTKGYTIKIAPGTYVENVDLDSDELFNLVFIGTDGARATYISPASGSSLATDADNTNLGTLRVKGITFTKPISLVGELTATHFLDVEGIFEDCFITLQSTTSLTVINANKFTWRDGEIHVLDTIAIQNVPIFTLGPNFKDTFALTGAPGETTLVANTGANVPYDMADANGGDDMVEYRVDHSFVQRKEPTITATAGKIRVNVRWSYFGLGMGMTFGTREHMYAWNSVFPGSITCGAGSVFRWRNSVCQGTLTTSSCPDATFYAEDTADG